MTPDTNPVAQTDLSRFAGMRAQIGRNPTGALKQVSQEFEAMFVQMMLKSARDAAPSDGMLDSNESRLYQEMFDEQVALGVAKQGSLGVEAMLRRQFAPYLGTDAAAPAATDAAPAPLRTVPALPMWERPLAADPVHELLSQQAPAALAPLVDAPDGTVPPNTAHGDARQQTFADGLREHAERAAARIGTTPEILIAQAALETGWGKHIMGGTQGRSSWNLFGVKASQGWNGDTVTHRTVEVLGGKPVQINAGFRAYDDPGQAFDDYADFILGNPRYQQAIEKASDPRAYVRELQRAGYATDPHYAQKILQIHAQVAANANSGSG